ncbi:flavin-binding monooxygenase-like family protein [Biscogniauxia sp. FL1348]|nr:flavin-binding monooxygenase-like family protein [Biscogniauxia sp. FL1348]
MATQDIKKKVAIIGAGIGGLVSLKECLAEGLEAEVFEARSEIGGQWAYQAVPEPAEGAQLQSSMYDGVTTNSCRDTTSFSDFPLDPARYPDFFGHAQMLQYINEYADRFNLRKHVHLRTNVVGCVPTEDAKWTVKLQEEGGDLEERTYDALFAATGARTIPNIPEFKGRGAFKGEFLHSQQYRSPGRFEGKRVVLVGLGSAAADLSCELAPACKEVHVITRRGGWILPRYILGKPAEAWDSRATQVWVPKSISEPMQTLLLNTVQGKHPQALQADHTILAQNPTVRSDLLERVRTGAIRVHRATVERFTESGLTLSDGTALEADVVIACTGYQNSLPYLPPDVLHSPSSTPPNTVDLWRLLVPIRYPNLFVMGFVELTGPSPPTIEAQARLAAAVLSGRAKLPPPAQLEAEVREWQAWQAKRFVRSERHATTDCYVPYIDRLLEPLGANPTLGRLLGQVFSSGAPWKALRTLSAVYFGVPTSAQWRLCGYGSGDKLARETVLRIAEGKERLSDEEIKYMST